MDAKELTVQEDAAGPDGKSQDNPSIGERMTTAGNQTNLQRAAKAYRLAIATKDDAARMAGEFPAASKKLEEAAKLLIAEGKKAEVD